MSNKNTPISIKKNSKDIRDVFSKNKLTDTIKYQIDGEWYRETISLDAANGDLGRSRQIEKVTQAFKDNPSGNVTNMYELVTNKDELNKIQSDSGRMNEYGTFLQDLRVYDGADEALDASGLLKAAKGDVSYSTIPLPEVKETASVTNEDTVPNQITPQEVFGGYDNLFKRPLVYPKDMAVEGESQDYLHIEQFLYSAPQAGTITIKEGAPEMGRVLKTGLSRQTNLGDPLGSCKLPVPNKLGVSQGVNWGEGRANAVELGAFQAANDTIRRTLRDSDGLGDVIKNVFQGGREQIGSTFNTIQKQIRNQDGTANAGAVINAVLARSLLGRIGINVDVEQFVTRETGAAINPNLELLFGGPQLRTFSFVFNFAPNSTDEAKEVRLIQRWFRQGMLPRKTTNFGGGSLFLGSPNIFRLCYKNNRRRIRGLNTFKICAVTSVQVDFTPDGVYQSYQDGDAVSQPVRSTMAVTFNELTPIFANDYRPEFDDDPSLDDVKDNISGNNRITEDDLGF